MDNMVIKKVGVNFMGGRYVEPFEGLADSTKRPRQ
jgi:hypothetical protein